MTMTGLGPSSGYFQSKLGPKFLRIRILCIIQILANPAPQTVSSLFHHWVSRVCDQTLVSV